MTLKKEILKEIKGKEHVILQAEICKIKGVHITSFNRWVVTKRLEEFNDINVLNAISKHLNRPLNEITE